MKLYHLNYRAFDDRERRLDITDPMSASPKRWQRAAVAAWSEGMYQHAADFADSLTLDDVFALSQNLTRGGWLADHNGSHLSLRSTSVGDIIIDDKGRYWLVDSFGFKALKVSNVVTS